MTLSYLAPLALNHGVCVNLSLDQIPKSAQMRQMAPESSPTTDEIEVTPEMVEAGMTELARYRYDHGNEEEVLAAIFRAMEAARPQPLE